MLAARGRLQRFDERGIFQPEIQEAGTGDFDRLAYGGNIKLGDHVRRELARI